MAITKIQSESLNLADNYDFTGTVTGAGESNVPYFQVRRTGSTQSLSGGSTAVAQFNTVDFDSGSYWDATNFKWIPPAGKYFFNANVNIGGASNGSIYVLYIRKNGTFVTETVYRAISTGSFSMNSSTFLSANGTDSFNVSLYSQTSETLNFGDRQSYFEGFLVSTT